ncbi:M12 family metallo-peptidase [bacterium]|nr:M12 family metallo-peptidase [bacterium]
MRNLIQLTIILVLTIICLPCWSSNANSGTQVLFEPDSASRSALDASERSNPMILRHRFAILKADRLLAGSEPAKTIDLPFFRDASFLSVNTKFYRRSQSSFTWIGYVPEARFSLVVLVVEGSVAEGHVNVSGRMYQIHRVTDGLYVIRELNQQHWRRHNDVPDRLQSREQSTSRDLSSFQEAASASTIDIMIVYTAARANGSINSEIHNAVATANRIFSDSQVNAQLRLVYSGQTSITESGSVDTDLQHLSNNSQIAALRDQYSADLVSMWVKDANGCGKANQVGPFSVVVEQGCVTPYDFTHEVGHCLGGNHDKYVNPGSNPFPYSHGLVHLEFIDPVCNGGWYTIMAYPDECQDKGILCCQITYFSNPNINNNGDPTGIPDEADNHRALNYEAPIAAGWKQPPSCSSSGVPSPVSPANGSTGISTTATLDWSAASNATSYRVEVATDSSFNNIVRSQSTTGTSWAITPGLATGTTYWWHVRGENSCSQSAFSQTWTFQTKQCSTPAAPALVSPANGAAGTTTAPALDWSASTGATSYYVQVAGDTSFGNVVRAQTVSGTTWTISPSLANATNYWWRVRAENSCVNGSFTQAWNFQTKSAGCTLPSVPSLISPSNGSTGISTSATLKWTSASGATSYEIQVAADSAFSNFVRSAKTSGTSWTVSPGLTPGKYYWRVRGTNSCGKSAYSSEWNFTTTCGITSQLLKNPGLESGNVKWSVKSSGIINSGVKYPARRGSWKAQLNGKGTSSTSWLYQQITIPSNACNATLSFYLQVVTAETTTTNSNDKLKVQILNRSGNLLKTLRIYSNLNKSSTYAKKSFDLSGFKGQTIRIRFYGSENGSKQTTFLIDDAVIVTKK